MLSGAGEELDLGLVAAEWQPIVAPMAKDGGEVPLQLVQSGLRRACSVQDSKVIGVAVVLRLQSVSPQEWLRVKEKENG